MVQVLETRDGSYETLDRKRDVTPPWSVPKSRRLLSIGIEPLFSVSHFDSLPFTLGQSVSRKEGSFQSNRLKNEVVGLFAVFPLDSNAHMWATLWL